MSGAVPWSVKGIDPRAREAAREAARRQGLTIGEWLNQAILANDADLGGAHANDPRGGRDERLADALRKLAERMEVDDRRNALALAGMDRSLSDVAARVEKAETDARTENGRVTDLLDELREAQTVLLEQMQRFEDDELPALRAEAAGGERLDRIEGDLHLLSAKAIAAEAATTDALAKLEGAMSALDAKLAEAVSPARMDDQAAELRKSFEAGLETVARDVASMVAETRADIAGQIVAALGGLQPEEMRDALADMSRRLAAAERRHTQTIEAVSIEIKRLSESMDRRLRVVEARNDDFAGAEMREEMASISRAVEHRMSEMETREAAAFARMGEEVGRIAERLDVRVANSEARSAQAIVQVGEQVALMTERLGARQDQLATDLAERIAQSEERQGGRLASALAAISERFGAIETDAKEALSPVSQALDSFAARLKALESHAGAPVTLPEVEPPSAPVYLEAPLPEPPAGAARPRGLEHEEDLHERAPASAQPEREPEPSLPTPTVDEHEPVYLEDIEAEFARRDEDAEIAPKFEIPERAPAARDLEDPFADIEASPPEDEDEDLFWSTGKQPAPQADAAPAQEHVDAHKLLRGLDEIDEEEEPDELTPLAHASRPVHSAGYERLDLDAEDEEEDFLGGARSFMEEEEIERDVFGAEEEEAPAPREDYLAAARRAAQANAAPKRSLLRSSDESSPAPGLRGLSRVILWSAAGALAAALAGGLYAYNAQREHVSDPRAAGKQTAVTNPPATSVADGAALAMQEPSAPAAAPAPEAAPSSAAPVHAAPLVFPDHAASAQPMSAVVTTVESAAAHGDPVAQYEIALTKLAGGHDADAIILLRHAAAQGLAMAQYRLAKLYERGEGVPQDLVQARQLTERAAASGNRKAMHDLGVYYARGEGAPFDEAAAFKWFRQAAAYGVTDSQFNLGVLYSQGRGVAADVSEAYYWFSVAASGGDADARARAAMLEPQLSASAITAVKTRAMAFKAKPQIARANGDFGPQAWDPPTTLQAAAEAPPRT